MYCSACGVAVAQGLSYCNYCGAKLNDVKDEKIIKPSGPKPELVVSSMVVVFVFGLGAITMLIGMMKAVLNLNVGVILAFALLSFLIMLSIEGVFVRLLFRRRHIATEAGDALLLKEQATNTLDPAQARALPESVPSVTEHTTRAFAPLYTDRTSK